MVDVWPAGMCFAQLKTSNMSGGLRREEARIVVD